MRNFTVQSLISLLVTSSALLLTPMISDAQVNMNRLVQVAKSCQEDMFSPNYYKQMGLPSEFILYNNKTQNQERLTYCINSRYHYSLLLTKYLWLDSTGEILPGYPGSVVVGSLAAGFGSVYHTTSILDCIANQDLSSEKCSLTGNIIALGGTTYRSSGRYNYTVMVCPSCVVAHDELIGSRTKILKAFIKWFIKLEKTQKVELISLLGDDEQAHELRSVLTDESRAGENKYWEVRQRVEEQEQERRRQELLGN